MTGDISRAVTLVTFGNAFLKRNYDIGTLDLSHHSFIYAHSVDFVEYNVPWIGEGNWVTYAHDPVRWLERLRSEGCRELRFVIDPGKEQLLGDLLVPHHKRAGFVGGGGRRYIEAVFEDHSDLWSSKEEVTHPEAADRRIWSISYGRMVNHIASTRKRHYDIAKIQMHLANVLSDIQNFAASSDPYWSEFFAKAHRILTTDDPLTDEHELGAVPIDMMTEGSIRLLAASRKAWCFGGMGSWNDIYIDDKKRASQYDELSAQLYSWLNESYVAIANSIE